MTPGDPRAGDACEVERQAAKPAADVERRCAVLRQELGGEVALLRGLRVVERLAGIFEIGAGILPVGVEEEVVQALVEVVVAGDIAPGAPPVVALVQAAKRDARFGQRLHPGLTLELRKVARAELQQVVKIALGDDEPSVHVEFAKRTARD